MSKLEAKSHLREQIKEKYNDEFTFLTNKGKLDEFIEKTAEAYDLQHVIHSKVLIYLIAGMDKPLLMSAFPHDEEWAELAFEFYLNKLESEIATD